MNQASRTRIERACAARLLTQLLESFPQLWTLVSHVHGCARQFHARYV
jgi:hypothetical protein